MSKRFTVTATQSSSERSHDPGRHVGSQEQTWLLHVRPMSDLHVPTRPVRVVTAASLFDGHDAAINVMRRILQSQGAEVIHLGHNRSVDEVVKAAVEEDVAAIARARTKVATSSTSSTSPIGSRRTAWTTYASTAAAAA